MSQHDPFVDHLKSLETTGPRVHVDRERVLRGGRRRRGSRVVGVAAGATAAVVGVCTAVAALPQPHSTRPANVLAAGPAVAKTPTAAPTHARVDPVTGRPTLPLDAWGPSATDVAIMNSAQELAMSRCMDDAGFADSYRFVAPEKPEIQINTYGVWDLADLEKYGYAGKPVSTKAVNPIDISAPGASDAIAECLTKVKPLDLSSGPEGIGIEGPRGSESAEYTVAGKKVIAEWGACLREHDLTPLAPDGGFGAKEAVGATLAEQVRVGKIDIACKKEVDLLQRMADIDAAEQRDYIERAHDYLVAKETYFKPIVANARAYLAASGYHVTGD